MREFPGRLRNFRLNRVEHGAGEYRIQKPEARRENYDTNFTNYHELELAGRDAPIAS